MYINSIGYYIPEKRIANDYFTPINGLTHEWIYKRTGIRTRSRANEQESMDYMCNKAIENVEHKLPYDISDVDLIIYASYTPSDTIATPGYYVQREYNITKAKVLNISTACSSAVNAMEVMKAFFDCGLASKSLLICAERNSTYSDDSDSISGHLWGDGATAYFFSDRPYSENDPQVVDIMTQGLGHIGHSVESVYLNLKEDGLHMPNGKDVFIHACSYMVRNTKVLLDRNKYSIGDLSYFIGHQANMRILKNVAGQLNLSDEKLLSNIEELGNTGSASTLLVFAQNYEKFKSGDLICLSVFGGGYSTGACLIKII